MRLKGVIIVAMFMPVFVQAASSTVTSLSIEEAVHLAIAVNPQVLSAKSQYLAAMHQIDQAYTPQDPQFTYSNNSSPNGLFHPSSISRGISESLQFPGKGWLQGDQAHRNAEIAKLTYWAVIRDTRAQAETVYYQTLLDSAAVEIALENAASFRQVMEVARVAYTGNQVTESDLISAQFSLTQASQTVATDQMSEANDEASLNQILGRKPENSLELTTSMALEPFALSLNTIKEKSLLMRQEILEAALTEKNNQTALKLAWMELLPDFNVSYVQTRYAFDAASPAGSLAIDSKDNTASIGFNIPIFFWFKQKEDIQSASNLLDAARQNKSSVELQTETTVVQLYRSTHLAYQTGLTYKNYLVPLAEKNLHVAMVAYQSKKVDYTTLAGALQNLYSARLAYLSYANQYLAGRVGLEQLMGGPIQ